VEAVYSSAEESDGQVSVHEPNKAIYSSSSSDSDDLEDTDFRDRRVLLAESDDDFD
jgi:hypothetical protein